MFDIEKELKKLPKKPGVYIMRDKNDNIIYVGKAISLKNRVTQYFRKNKKTKRIQNMVANIDHFEYIVVDNESGALVLECNLIKKNRPKFNVLLKDDKTYPYIKINLKDDYPQIYITRRVLNDGAKYFGPYPESGSANELVSFLKDKFKIRHCKNFRFKDRACLNYYINKCSGPCMGYISKEEYMKNINQVISILDGRFDVFEKEIKKDIEEASKNLEFEKAAFLRDKLYASQAISNKQKVSNINENDIDVIGLAKKNNEICIEIFFIRNSKMIGREHYFFKDIQDEKDSEILGEFVKQYYMNNKSIPNKIMLQEELEDQETIEKWLTEIAQKNVHLKIPQKGKKLRLVEMAENNAKITLENKQKDQNNILLELKEVCKLESLPRKIESYDISNIAGTNLVAAMCVMKDGEIKKGLSRRFKIKTVFGQDDPRCMKEVVERRLAHSIEIEKVKKGGFGNLPDLILADGGITQIRAIKEAIKNVEVSFKDLFKTREFWDDPVIVNSDLRQKVDEYGKLKIEVFGMVKNDKHQTRALMDENRNELPISENLFNKITQFQDAVHNTAIGYHRDVREKSMTKSKLDEIEGIGEAKRTALLKKFGSVENIKKASVSEIAKVKGINEKLAEKILKEL